MKSETRNPKSERRPKSERSAGLTTSLAAERGALARSNVRQPSGSELAYGSSRVGCCCGLKPRARKPWAVAGHAQFLGISIFILLSDFRFRISGLAEQ